MNIYGEKVILRAIEAEDNDMLLSLVNDPETEKNLGGASFPTSSTTQKRWFESQTQNDSVLRCVIAKKDDPKTGLGTVILSGIDRRNGVATVHIKLCENARGQGLGTDSVKAVVKYAFYEQRLNCVNSAVIEYNLASQKMFEKCGFKKDGVLRQRVYKNGKYYDMHSFSVLKDEYDALF